MNPLLGLDAAREKPTARVVLTPADHFEAVAAALPKNLVLGFNSDLTRYDLAPLKGRVVTLWIDCDQSRPLKETLARVHAVCEAVSKVAAETAWFDTTPLHHANELTPRVELLRSFKGGALTEILKARRVVWRPEDTRPKREPVADAPRKRPQLSVVDGPTGAVRAPREKPAPDEEPATDPADLLPLAYTHDALASQFVERHAGRWLYCSEAKRWRLWDGTVWADDRRLAVQHDARILCREQADRAAMDPDLAPAKQASTASNLSSRPMLDAMLGLARTDPRISIDEASFDADPWLLNTPAGVWDLREGRMLDHTPERLMMKITAVAPLMREDGSLCADCPRWMEFLNFTQAEDDEVVEFLQSFVGYSATGDTSEQQFVFAYGTGGNGKGTFINVVSDVLGDYATTADPATFTESRFERHPTELAMLKGARFVSAQETEEGKRWHEARLKALTGGDPITARFMRQDNFTYKPQFKLFIAGNYQPLLHNVDEAIRRRINLVPFTRKPEAPDRRLAEALRDEYPGILAWILEGARLFVQRGLVRPKSVTAATQEYLHEQDTFGAWLADRTTPTEHGTVRSRELYADYVEYTKEAGEGVYSQKRFAQNMMARGFKGRRNKDGRYYEGLTLNPAPIPSAHRMPWDRD